MLRGRRARLPWTDSNLRANARRERVSGRACRDAQRWRREEESHHALELVWPRFAPLMFAHVCPFLSGSQQGKGPKLADPAVRAVRTHTASPSGDISATAPPTLAGAGAASPPSHARGTMGEKGNSTTYRRPSVSIGMGLDGADYSYLTKKTADSTGFFITFNVPFKRTDVFTELLSDNGQLGADGHDSGVTYTVLKPGREAGKLVHA